jgi:hypothetical protein
VKLAAPHDAGLTGEHLWFRFLTPLDDTARYYLDYEYVLGVRVTRPHGGDNIFRRMFSGLEAWTPSARLGRDLPRRAVPELTDWIDPVATDLNEVRMFWREPPLPTLDPDGDGDGYVDADEPGSCGSDATRYPSLPDVPDGVDNDCDGTIDEDAPPSACPDADGDGFTDRACGGLDCNDWVPLMNPDAAEICDDQLDNNCNGEVNEGVGTCPDCTDGDGDGFGTDCASGEDCDDSSPLVSPAATEVCGNGIDEDCSGADLVCAPGALCEPCDAQHPCESGLFCSVAQNVCTRNCSDATVCGGFECISTVCACGSPTDNAPPVGVIRYALTPPAGPDPQYFPYDANNPPSSPVPVGTTVYLSGRESYDPDGDLTELFWLVEDGSGTSVPLGQIATAVENDFVPVTAGTHSVHLQVTEIGAEGLITNVSLAIPVDGCGCGAGLRTVAILNYGGSGDYFEGNNKNSYLAYQSVIDGDPLGRFSSSVVTTADLATLAADVLLLPDNYVPPANVSEVDAWFDSCERTIVCADSAVTFAYYAGYLDPALTGTSGRGSAWTYDSLADDQKVVALTPLTEGFSIGQVLPSAASNVRFDIAQLLGDTVVATVSAASPQYAYGIHRDVPGAGRVVVLGTLDDPLSGAETLIRNAAACQFP